MFRSAQEFRNSSLWRNLRRRLMKERGDEYGSVRCEHCGQIVENDWECHAHHTVELTMANVNDHTISLNPDLIMLVHHKCHNEIHERWGTKGRRVFLVVGAPCSGKSTYVKQVAGPHDLILDIDNIWEAISGTGFRHAKSERIKRVVFSVWDNLLDSVKTRNGDWQTAYVITTAPMLMDRERMINRLGCEVIHIDTDKVTCINRATNGRPKDFIKYIEDYFEKYQPPQGEG